MVMQFCVMYAPNGSWEYLESCTQGTPTIRQMGPPIFVMAFKILDAIRAWEWRVARAECWICLLASEQELLSRMSHKEKCERKAYVFIHFLVVKMKKLSYSINEGKVKIRENAFHKKIQPCKVTAKHSLEEFATEATSVWNLWSRFLNSIRVKAELRLPSSTLQDEAAPCLTPLGPAPSKSRAKHYLCCNGLLCGQGEKSRVLKEHRSWPWSVCSLLSAQQVLINVMNIHRSFSLE